MAEKSSSAPRKQKTAEEQTRSELAAEQNAAQEERDALKKAREAEVLETDGDSGEAGYANLHYGDEKSGKEMSGAAGVESFAVADTPSSAQALNNNGASRNSGNPGETDNAGPDATNEAQRGTEDPSNPGRFENLPNTDGFDGTGNNDAPVVTAQLSEPLNTETQQNSGAQAPGSRASSTTDDGPALAAVNDAPTDVELSNDTVAENNSGAVIANLSASDPDTNDTATFSLAEDSSGLFEVVGNELRLKDGVSLDHEARNSYEITIAVEDSVGNIYTETVTINVADVNENPTDISFSGDNVAENNAGAVVATLSSADPDAGDTATYSLTEDPSGFFEVVGNELKLKDGVALDHEVQDAFEVTVAVEDGAGNVYTETLTINVADINETPTDIVFSGDSVDENNAGAVVATLSSADPDAGDTATYSLAEDSSGFFEVVGNELKLKDGVALDHEAQDAFEVTVAVEDGVGNVYTETLTINVADVNEAPVDFVIDPVETKGALSLNQDGGDNDVAIASNVEGFPTTALTVEVTFASSQTDVGSGVPLFSYAADGGHNNEALVWLESSSGKVAIFLGGQRFLTDIDNASLLNGEEHQVSFTWDQSTDQLSVYVDGVEEFSRSVSVRDLRADGTITFGQEQDAEGGRYDANQIFEGEISEVRVFDHARTAEEIADNAGGPIENPQGVGGLVSNWVMNESEGGVVEDLTGNNDLVLQNGAKIVGGETFDTPTVVENETGMTVGVLSAIDPDTGDAITDFSIADDPSGLFEIAGNELKLKDGASVDFEANDSFELTLEAADASGLSTPMTVTINVADVNEKPTDIDFSGNTVDENTAGATVATLSASDADAGDTATFSLADDPSGFFEVVGNELKLKDGVALDHEAQNSYQVTVAVEDSAGNVYAEAVTVNVGDVNDAPTDIRLSGADGGAFQEQGGLLVIEAEHFDTNAAGDGHAWGDSNAAGAVHVDNNGGNDMWRDQADVEANAPELTYQVEFETPGTYYVHIRGAAEDGPTGNADSVHIGLDGERLSGDGGITGFGGAFGWGNRDTYTGQTVKIVVDEPGVHTLNLWAREDGVSVDKIVLTQDESYRPSGEGPAESPRTSGEGLAENSVGGTVVATLSTVDQDTGDSHTYEFVDADGNPVANEFFEIIGNEIRVKDGADIDFEATPNISFNVKTTDTSGASYQENVTVDVSNVNEGPTGIVLSDTEVPEGDAGASVATLTVIDPDAGDVHDVTVSDDRFEVVGGELRLKDGVSLDHETAETIDISVTATDAGGESVTENFSINVADVNEGPALGLASGEGLQASYYNVGSTIRRLSDIDFDVAPDAEGVVSSLNYMGGGDAFWEGGPQNQFAAKYEGQLVVEEGGSYTINLASDDGSQLYINGELVLDNDGLHGTRTQSVTLDLEAGSNNIEVRYFENTGAQTLRLSWNGPDTGGSEQVIEGDAFTHGATFDSLSVSEHEAGAAIAALTVSDPDDDDTHAFSVDDDRFEVVDVDGEPTLKLKEGVSLNHEEAAEVTVAVTVTDAGGASDTQAFAIAVENTNTAPEISLQGGEGLQASYYDVGHSISNLDEVDFNAAPDATAVVDSLNYTAGQDAFWDGAPNDFFAAKYEGQLVVEEGGTYTINLASDDGSQLFIDGVEVLDNDGLHATRTRSVSVDLEAGSHNIEVRYFENGGQQTLKLSWSGPDTGGAEEVVSGNSFLLPGYDEGDYLGVTENVAGDVAAHLSVADAEGDNVSFAVSDDRFGVVETEHGYALQLKEGVSLDHETESEVSVTVTATDEHGESSSTTLVVPVADVEEAIVLNGTPGADRIRGTNADEVINGLGGNDRLEGRGGDDTVYGDGGNDIIIGGAGADELHGGAGNDRIYADADDTAITGGAGSDRVIVQGSGDFTIDQTAASVERVDGGAGNDAMDATGMTARVRQYGRAGDDTLTGGDNNDIQVGGAGADVISGGAGRDNQRGGAGDDVISGGDGNDNIRGDAGADQLHGGAGNDRIYADADDTAVTGGEGSDRVIVQGSGDFTIDQTAASVERVDGGAGNDAMDATGMTARVRQYGRAGDDTLTGGGNNDVQSGGAGADVISGGDGRDNQRGGDGDDVIAGGDGADNIRGDSGDDTLTGDSGNDRIYGGDGGDVISGGDGADRLYGDVGNDVLSGGADNDRMYGGVGDDTLTGDTGADRLYGGDGNDVFVYASGDGSDRIDGGAGAWTDAIEIEGGISTLGEFGVDWTIQLTQGSIVTADSDAIVFTDDAAGTISLDDGAVVQFENLEQII